MEKNNWLKKNIKNIAAAGMATVGSLAIHNDANAQIFKHKDKKSVDTEQGINTQEQKIESAFDKTLRELKEKYKSDNLCYRAVAVYKSIDENEAYRGAEDEAENLIFKEATLGEGGKVSISNTRTIDSKMYKNSSTGIYTHFVVMEVDKSDVKVVK
jgi:hypothetical protein